MPTQDELKQWFVDEQPAGMALVCGAVAGNLLRLDIDSEAAYTELREAGAFPAGTSIAVSDKGHYGVFLRADMIPFSVKEYTIPGYPDIGISGDRALGIVPDSPDRKWLKLYDKLPVIKYEAWLLKYLHHRRGDAHTGEELSMCCPYHEDSTPSLYINTDKGVYYCQGCGAKGKIHQLIADSHGMGFELPKELTASIMQGQPGAIDWRKAASKEPMVPLIDGLLGSGEHAKLLIIGDAKVGKTSLGLGIVLPVCMGRPALLKLNTLRPLRSVYINFEQGSNTITDDIQAQAVFYPEPEEGQFMLYEGLGERLSDGDYQRKLLTVIRNQRVELLLLDSLYMAVNNVNDPDETQKVLDFLAQVVAHGCALIMMHHTTESRDGGQARGFGWLGRQLERWGGTTLKYEDKRDKEGKRIPLWGSLTGIIRWGHGYVDYPISYEMFTRSTVMTEYGDVPGWREGQVGGLPERILQTRSILVLARRCGYTQVQVAKELGISDRTVRKWMDEDTVPGGENWQQLLALQRKIQAKLRGIPGSTPSGQ